MWEESSQKIIDYLSEIDNRIIISGPQNSFKSTFVQYQCNRILSEFP